MAFFKILKKSKKSKARLGVISAKHGIIKTPAFVPVATKGTLKGVLPRDVKTTGTQVAFVNTFHLVSHPGSEVVQKFGGIHNYTKLDLPLMSDSAGFQVFSLGAGKHTRQESQGKLRYAKSHEGEDVPVERITEEGVWFRSPRDGKKLLFTPETSVRHQKNIGADLIMAFDECIYYGAGHEYTKSATNRTHRWLERCIKTFQKDPQKPGYRQYLYGIIQGGVFKDLRIDSAKFIAAQPVDGIAIGGVSVGETKRELREQVEWVTDYLPEGKPVHLLGVGHVDDIFDLIRYGIDTFDCVEPTRIARNGAVYQWKNGKKFTASAISKIDLGKSKYIADKNPIQKGCKCYTCQNFSLSFLNHLFKERELVGYSLATIHNVRFFSDLFEEVRKAIRGGKI
ncbi:MAG: hypothetical protein A3E07_00105 [Candidatus Wildermuthbacteria bacterium RIFCSPHIGHO2_12_FULL_45_9]|uniref:Queuine tRNA-ribosyltransferase n=1 Tax=Candidatus Wildermuthbacteria bacterium RIFCSPHIGHO2_02_FULL_45_25 TaxID=1802450 RepID=A0A1G2QZ66_9BACT|nr:MAG: hypothetical protein A2748_01420 [Candidatus Wildermuthbacteria bacterium RIFCSPHIGHO2_01_FULL_45_20]OHA65648.1 MAG: hypothetical protein A3C04_01610 [Candidatus Wildermuthbacteria bacterium RIFCSPHIGHO2_02_FULL_45_25]OHA70341.1 MAG: hypothetical protein A3E07_00105 [Candidatus Wildermuthbacteria bacterium RIFCSPHIGHO2_12_FULL_45_9]